MDEGIGSKESASLENDNTTDSKSEDSGHQVLFIDFLKLLVLFLFVSKDNKATYCTKIGAGMKCRITNKQKESKVKMKLFFKMSKIIATCQKKNIATAIFQNYFYFCEI